MVDHNLWGLKFNCDKAFLLHNGNLLKFDDVEQGIAYYKILLEKPANHEVTNL